MAFAEGNARQATIATLTKSHTGRRKSLFVLFRINLVRPGPGGIREKLAVFRMLRRLYYIALTKFATHSFILFACCRTPQ
jgi:hypothetical protein